MVRRIDKTMVGKRLPVDMYVVRQGDDVRTEDLWTYEEI